MFDSCVFTTPCIQQKEDIPLDSPYVIRTTYPKESPQTRLAETCPHIRAWPRDRCQDGQAQRERLADQHRLDGWCLRPGPPHELEGA